MKRENYENYKWYPLTDNEYWVDVEYQDEFPDCQTIVYDTKEMPGVKHSIMPYDDCYISWGTMAKLGTFNFMIIEKPKCNVLE
jgi:hypothetical protein